MKDYFLIGAMSDRLINVHTEKLLVLKYRVNASVRVNGL